MGVAGLQYRPCRARGETRQAPRRPGGAEKRPRRGGTPAPGKRCRPGSAPANPGGAQNAPAGRAICYKLSVKTPSWGKEFAVFHKNRRENDNSKINKLHNAQNAGETGGVVRNKTALKVLKNACFYKKQKQI